jgi:hypothetical protein
MHIRYCPKCRGEFENWVQVCPDCHVSLADTLPEVQKPIIPPKSVPLTGDIVTIASYLNPETAYILSERLKSEGIQSSTIDENAYTYALGGARLQVFKSDVDRAIKLLDLKNEITKFTSGAGPTCPSCCSTDVGDIAYSSGLELIMYLLTLGYYKLVQRKRKWKCRTCGYEWNDKDQVS